MKTTIILFGFSGSGKSVMAKRIARRLGLRVVHPSGILRAICLGKPVKDYETRSNRGFWESARGQRLLRDRLSRQEPPDVLCDRLILQEARRGNVVIDSWSLPWIYGGGIKVYLRAPRTCRAQRVARRDRLDEAAALRIVGRKDRDTRKLYQRIRGFDMARDLGMFGLILDTKALSKNEVEDRLVAFVRSKSSAQPFSMSQGF